MKSKNRFCKAKNPHNQFIYEYFTQQKMKCIGTGREKLAFGYQKILMALQKYPLPLLTEEQAMAIQGVGPKTSTMIVKLLNTTYKEHQNMSLQLNEALAEDLEFQEEIHTNTCPTTFDFRPQEIQLGTQISFNNITKQSQLKKGFLENLTQGSKMLIRDQEQHTSQPNTKTKQFIPQKNSKAWGVLLSLYTFEEDTQRSFASRRQIKEISSKFKVDIAQWNMLETLEKHNLIIKSQLGDEIKYSLTGEGKNVASKLITEYNGQKEQQQQVKSDDDPNTYEITILVDNRERFSQQNRSVIVEKLHSIYGLKCRQANMPVGDFLWVVKIGQTEYVLDYIVERKTLSDLSHSIIDKRYNDQKYKLKNCGLSRLFYLIENTNSSLAVSRAAVDKAIRSTQIRDGFLIQKTESLEDSLLWIANFTKLIKIKEKPQKTLQEFMLFNSTKGISVQHQWGCMVKALSGAGQEITRSIVDRWQTPIAFYEEINKTTDVHSLLQGKTNDSKNKQRVTQNLAKLVEIIFKEEEYPDFDVLQEKYVK